MLPLMLLQKKHVIHFKHITLKNNCLLNCMTQGKAVPWMFIEIMGTYIYPSFSS